VSVSEWDSTISHDSNAFLEFLSTTVAHRSTFLQSHIIILVNKGYNIEKIWQKWLTNGCINQLTAFLGRKMADG